MATAVRELCLISASSAVGEPADCDLVFRLGEEEGLPDFTQVHPWAGKTITPLRDRLMIHWLFTQPEAQKQLKRMITEINKVLKRSSSHGKKQQKSKESVTRIRVGIVCQNGALLSPCFVEKLYEYYNFYNSVWEGLEVRRYHWDAFSGSWGKNKDFVWQYVCVPMSRKKTIMKHLFNDKWWVNFSSSTSRALDEAFLRDPYCTNFENEDGVFDFESGTMYHKRVKTTYNMRCSVAVSSSTKVISWFLSHNAYITAVRYYKAAGILPYSVHPLTGEAVFLLGHITYATMDWCDFGGLKSLGEKPRHTAARECREETFGILGTTAHLSAALRNFVQNNAFKVVNQDTGYVGHFLRVPYDDYPSIFAPVMWRKANQGKTVEVNKMRWVPLSSLRTAVQMTVMSQRDIAVEPIHKDGSLDTRCHLPLRREFAHSVCIADKLGILKSIEHIAREIHQPQPTPMPYVSFPKPRGEPAKSLARPEASQTDSKFPQAHTLSFPISSPEEESNSDSSKSTIDDFEFGSNSDLDLPEPLDFTEENWCSSLQPTNMGLTPHLQGVEQHHEGFNEGEWSNSEPQPASGGHEVDTPIHIPPLELKEPAENTATANISSATQTTNHPVTVPPSTSSSSEATSSSNTAASITTASITTTSNTAASITTASGTTASNTAASISTASGPEDTHTKPLHTSCVPKAKSKPELNSLSKRTLSSADKLPKKRVKPKGKAARISNTKKDAPPPVLYYGMGAGKFCGYQEYYMWGDFSM